jgi:5-dehydro-4-deoxyglucarate dehydratase
MAFNQREIIRALSDGLLSFPITDFDANGEFNADSYQNRLNWLKDYDVSTLFVAGGTGEFFSLAPDELDSIIETAVSVCGGSVPIVSSAGKSQREAIQHARAAERNGADALLLMPPYLTEAPQVGLVNYIRGVCDETSLPVVVYNRANGQLTADSVAEIAKNCGNLIGLKDGVGNVSSLNTIIKTVGDRLVYIGGVPTAEIMAEAYLAIGVKTYSSAVFNFVPEQAVAFYQALREGRHEHVHKVLKEFFVPFVELRSRCKGYAVSLIKAGAEQVGHPGGPVRAPLVMPTDEENKTLSRLIDTMKQAG